MPPAKKRKVPSGPPEPTDWLSKKALTEKKRALQEADRPKKAAPPPLNDIFWSGTKRSAEWAPQEPQQIKHFKWGPTPFLKAKAVISISKLMFAVYS